MDKDEGETLASNFANRASNSEGHFEVDFDNQISGLEEQLQKAQKSLFDLQSLKKRLEDERRKNEEQVKYERERISIDRLQTENERLKDNLKNYQGEIVSLKRVIGSLRNDLKNSAELFRSNVENSLRLLEKADDAIQTDPSASNMLEFEQSIDPKPVIAQVSTSTDIKLPEVPQSISVPTTPENTKSELTATPEKPTEPTPVAQVNAQEKPAETSQVTTASPTPDPAKPATAESAATENSNLQLTQELSEYEKIQKELEELEKESISQINAVSGGSNQPEAAQAPTPTAQPAAPATPSPAPATLTPPVSEPSASQPQQNQPAPTTPPTQPQTPTAEKPSPTQAAPAPQTPSNDQAQAASQSPQTDQGQGFWREQNTQSAQPSVETPEKKPTPRKRRFLFFKRKEKEEKVLTVDQNQTETPNEKSSGGGKLLVKTAVFLFLLLSAGITYQIKNADKLRNLYTTQAQDVFVGNTQTGVGDNVPEEFAKTPPEVRYREAYIDAPLEETVWDTYNDSGLEVKIDYPKNTSYRLKPVGSENLWFLRKTGYLMKIERIDIDASPEKYWEEHKSDIDYKQETVNFKGHSALHLVQNEYLPVRGNMFILLIKNKIYKVWYQTFAAGENPDDQKRVERMLESLQFVKD